MKLKDFGSKTNRRAKLIRFGYGFAVFLLAFSFVTQIIPKAWADDDQNTYSWTPSGSMPRGEQNWNTVVASYDGQYMAALSGGTAGTEFNQLYVSNDKGNMWTPQSSTIEYEFSSLASSFTGDTLIAGSYSQGVFLSADHGSSWTHHDIEGLNLENDVIYSVDVSRWGTYLVASGYSYDDNKGLLFTSEDAGETWVQQEIPESTNGFWVQISGTDPDPDTGNFLVGVAYNDDEDSGDVTEGDIDQVYTSDDLGATWTLSSAGVDANIADLKVSNDGWTMLMMTSDLENSDSRLIYVSTDRGETWDANYLDEGRDDWSKILFANQNGGSKMGVIADDGALYTSDAGEGWSPWQLESETAINFQPGAIDFTPDGSMIFGGELEGSLFTSVDDAQTFSMPVTHGYHHWKSIASSGDGKYLIAGDGEKGLFGGWNYADSWLDRSNYFEEDEFRFEYLSVASDGYHMIAASSDKIYVSSDRGMSWIQATDTPAIQYSSVKLSSESGYAVLSGENGAVYISEDYGDTWHSVDSLDGSTAVGSVAISSDGSHIAFADTSGPSHPSGSLGVVYTSDDYGTSWSMHEVDETHGISAIASSADGLHLVATGDDVVYTSRNGGTTWAERTVTENSHDIWEHVATSSSGRYIVMTDNSSVYTSSDYGATWHFQADVKEHNWSDVAISNDGKRIALAPDEWEGQIWLGVGTFTENTDPEPDDTPPVDDSEDSDDEEDSTPSTSSGSNDDTPKPKTKTESKTETETDTEETDSVAVQLTNAEDHEAVALKLPAGSKLTCSSAAKESSLKKLDDGYVYPLGFVDFCFTTAKTENTVSLIFVSDLDPKNVIARKYDDTTGKYATVEGAVIEKTTYNGQAALKVTYTITDNGPLDSDPAVGAITDPVGLATVPANPHVATETTKPASQAFNWWWIVAAAGAVLLIIIIIVTRKKRSRA